MQNSTAKVISFLGIFLGAISIFILLHLGLDIGLSAPIAALVEYYDRLVDLCFSWAVPIASHIVSRLNEIFAISLVLDPIWKHFVVLLFLYFSADVRANIEIKRFGLAYVSVVWGVIVGTLGGIAAGLTAPSAAGFNYLTLIISVVSVVVFELGRVCLSVTFRMPSPSRSSLKLTRKEIFIDLIWRFPLSTTLIGGISVLSIFYANENLDIPPTWSLNIVGVFFFIMLLALYLFARTAIFFLVCQIVTGKLGKNLLRSVQERHGKSSSSRVGLLMFSTVAGAVLFIALNAGLVSIGP